MKSKALSKSGFKPIDLTISIESKEELSAIYVLFNHTYVLEAPGMGAINATAVRASLQKAAEGRIEYSEQFDKLDRHIKLR
jgi:hypothetical protein